ncbi:hypothetical protein [Rhodococcus opacus]|uniref:hypothetical protein n=1 Tax=Rhodococcus opacus TaxID=37919 RepID=UPI001F588007|nr:hypothetical protein [Rhodococcus opacus]UNN05308.1 hypothetical protein MOO23_41050 [Rhodococcus opacus]
MASLASVLLALGGGVAAAQPTTTPAPGTSTTSSATSPAPEPTAPSSSTTTTTTAAPAPTTTQPAVPASELERSAAPSSSTQADSSVPTTTPSESAPSAPTSVPPADGKKIPYTGKPTENPNATLVPGKMRSDREELPEGFTKEEADKAEMKEAELQKQTLGLRAAVAPGCQVYWPSDFQVCGAIRDKYNSLGAQFSFLGFPTTNELTNPDGHGKRSVFVNGPIYWSAASGAHPVVNHFFAAWQRNGWETGPLGYPTTDEIVNPDNFGRRQEFQNTAAIYWNVNEAYAVRGAIRDKWNTVNAERPGSLLGYPISDEKVLPDGQGRMNRFERGVLYWHPSFGAHPVSGIILSEWTETGFETGQYGYPTSDERAANPGRIQDFQRGQLSFGTLSDASDQLYDCAINVSWPERHSSTYWVKSNITANCADPKKKIEAVTNWFYTPPGGNEQRGRGSVLTATDPVNNVHTFSEEYLSPCTNATWRLRVVFNITNADGGVMSDRKNSEPIAINGCESIPPNCPSSIQTADCNATIQAYMFALKRNYATQPGYSGFKEFNNDFNHIPPPIGKYLEYDIYPNDSPGGRRAERLLIDDGDPTGKIWFSKDHFTTQAGYTGFELR